MSNKLKNSEDTDDEYIPELNPLKRKRSKSESDIFLKIIHRSKEDIYFRKQNREKQIEILSKEDEIYSINTNNITSIILIKYIYFLLLILLL